MEIDRKLQARYLVNGFKMDDVEENLLKQIKIKLISDFKTMTSHFKIKSYAKINLALNVIGKSKSLHKIESIVGFLDLHDEIKIKKLNINIIKLFLKVNLLIDKIKQHYIATT